MGIFKKELRHCARKQIHPLSRTQPNVFDVETTYAEAKEGKKRSVKKYRGPDSLLYAAVYPLVIVIKVFGLAPYDFTADQMTASTILLLFTFIFMALYSHILYRVFLRFITLKRTKSLLSVVETTKVVVNYLVVMFDLFATIFTRKAFARLWNALQNFDVKLNHLGYPRTERNTVIAAWILFISQAIVWTMINQSGMYTFQEPWTFNVSYMCPYVGTSLSVYKFFGMASFLGQRFHQLNQIARENLPARVGYKSTCLSRKTIQDLHNELMLSGEALGSIYSWSLLFWLGNLSVHSVSNLYFIIDWTMLTPWTDITAPLVFNMCSWLVGFIAQILAIHVACDYTVSEANSMAAIMVEWDARIIKRFPTDDTVRTSLHFLNRRLSFSAGGLCDVNLALLNSIVGELSKYLILLLQFPG